jgi:hypothetical protein
MDEECCEGRGVSHKKVVARYKACNGTAVTVLGYCECKGKKENHHENYEKPLDVYRLCKKCHMELHHNGKSISDLKIISQPKTMKFNSMMDLAIACGVHVDTLHKSKRQGFCSRKLSEKLEKATGLGFDKWYKFVPGVNPWARVGIYWKQ